VSNPIRYDPPLVSALADELNARLGGRHCTGLPHSGADRAVEIPFVTEETLRFDLHPARGWVRLVGERGVGATGSASDWRLTSVASPEDERLLYLDLESGNRFRPLRRRLVVELHTNQWNAVLVEPEGDRILAALRPRSAGQRKILVGEPYHPPPHHPRLGSDPHREDEAWQAWCRAVGTAKPEERARVLIREFAHTGSLNAGPILAPLAGPAPEGVRESFERWWRIACGPSRDPVLLELDSGLHPYPFPLTGTSSRPADSILSAMAEAAATLLDGRRSGDALDTLLVEMERRRTAADRRLASLTEQLHDGETGEAARRLGDLVLANLASIEKGASRVTLQDWEGGEVEVELDPALGAAENAARFYDLARRRQRALDRLPPLIREAEAERDRWDEILRTTRDSDEVPEPIRRELARRAERAQPARESGGTRLPYRTFRTTGGLEVRIGRGAAENDRLTFGHSRPNDVWMHARSVPGSHVIVRWADPQQQPPGRDLNEAAGLAAWFSKARTSGLVPVDWTRRKHVRKPRGAPPGAVVPMRVRTILVEPDAGLADRLEVPELSPARLAEE
jgi:predicted ribosome quality control (RQC) complex YloA/Tae2 family protein